MRYEQYQCWAVCLALTLFPAAGGAEERMSIDSSLAYDGSGRWRGYGILNANSWSFGAAGRWDPAAEITGMAGINSALLTLGHLSDAGLAAEVRNPECGALSRLSERTVFRADLRSFSASRFGIVLSPWEGRVGVGWERRANIDTGLIWASPIHTDFWHLELLWAYGMLAPKAPKDDWYPDESSHPGGPFAAYAVRNRFEKGPWRAALTGIVSSGVNFRPGFLLAGAAGLSIGPWKTRLRGTWSTEFYRNAEGELPSVPVGVAWDGRLSPKRGFLLAAGFHLPLWTYQRNSSGSNETAWIDLGWRFASLEVRARLEWNGLTRRPDPQKIAGKVKWKQGRLLLEVNGSWDFIRDWSIRLKGEWKLNAVCSLETAIEVHRETALLIDGRIGFSLRYAKGKFTLNCAAADFPRDWEGGPESAGDLDIEFRWMHKFH